MFDFSTVSSPSKDHNNTLSSIKASEHKLPEISNISLNLYDKFKSNTKTITNSQKDRRMKSAAASNVRVRKVEELKDSPKSKDNFASKHPSGGLEVTF